MQKDETRVSMELFFAKFLNIKVKIVVLLCKKHVAYVIPKTGDLTIVCSTNSVLFFVQAAYRLFEFRNSFYV